MPSDRTPPLIVVIGSGPVEWNHLALGFFCHCWFLRCQLLPFAFAFIDCELHALVLSLVPAVTMATDSHADTTDDATDANALLPTLRSLLPQSVRCPPGRCCLLRRRGKRLFLALSYDGREHTAGDAREWET